MKVHCLLMQEIVLVIRVFSARSCYRVSRFLNVFIARKRVETVRDLLLRILLTYNRVLIILLYLPRHSCYIERIIGSVPR